ncbi:MAG TPA: winged helix-turn-helix domain-containing protein [Ilumatobacteraceae bacterium]|nr:winged helix-turn-helix domain-containing protein [Ilumatobacteraceae bacterium]
MENAWRSIWPTDAILSLVRTHTPFLGRAGELGLLEALATDYRLVSLVGPGGIGKTRLAREFALATHASLEGNVLFATLAGATGEDDIADLVARNAGLASADALRYGSVDRPRLIVLDNCESALEGAAGLARSLIEADRTTRVLVTTRTPLGLAEERVVMLGPLAVPPDDDPHRARSAPTVQLFIDRAQRAGALSSTDDDTLVDIARLVRQLDGMPLAIELAAARTRVLSPRQISALLDDELGLLHRPGNEADRHESMRAVIAASYEPLAPHVQAGFRALCVFNAPFDLDLAQLLMGTPTELDAVEIATELIDASLLVTMVDQGTSNRYRLLEPIRWFGLERLEADDEMSATVERFVDVMAAYADAFVAKVLTAFSPDLFATVSERLAHLVHAIDECLHRDATAARANRLFLPLFGTSRNRGEQIALVRRIIATWDDRAPLHLEARAVMASVATFGGDTPLAVHLTQEVLDDDTAGDLPRLLAHRCLGFLEAYSGDLMAARAQLGDALLLARSISPAFAREIECSRAATSSTPDDIAESLDVLDQAAADATRSGSIIVAQWAHTVAAELCVRQGALDAALEHAREALTLSDRTGYAWSAGAAHKRMATVLGAREGWAPAAPQFRLSFDAHLFNGDITGAAGVVRSAAAVALHIGEHRLADDLWTSFPIELGRSIVSPAFEEEDRLLAQRHGVRRHDDLAASIRAVRTYLGRSVPAETPPGPEGVADPADVTVIRFGDCELDIDRFELRRSGSRVPMEPQVFDVLAYLAQRRSRMVPKEELLDEIWGDRFVSESALTSRIKAARQATGDDGGAQRVIRTVRGRGYMFVAAVHGD